MAVIATGDITLPQNIAAGMFSKAVTGSAIAQLSGAEPMKFGDVSVMTFSAPPRAEYVAAGADKSSTTGTFDTVTVTPKKAQVTMRFDEEVKWADEDYQLGVLATLADAGGVALARALDLGAFHGLNPLSGTVTALIPAGHRIATTTNSVEAAGSADTEVEAAAGLVIADGFIPTGIALDPTYAWTLATARYDDGRKKYPDLGLGTDISSFENLRASVSSTVSGLPEADTDTDVKAIIGQWDLLRWGVQRRVPIRMLESGDPDGQGDLARKNQIALRLEVVYGWAVLDLDGFAVIVDAV